MPSVDSILNSKSKKSSERITKNLESKHKIELVAPQILEAASIEPKLINYKYLSISPDNKYGFNMDEVYELAESIRHLGLIDSLAVEYISKEKYEILGGQKRYMAITYIKENFPDDYSAKFPNDKIPCKIFNFKEFHVTSEDGSKQLSDDMLRSWIIAASNQQHEKSVSDLMLQVSQLSDVYKELKEKGMLPAGGKQRDFISNSMNLKSRSIQKVLTAKKSILPELWNILLSSNQLTSISMLEELSLYPDKIQSVILDEFKSGHDVDLEEYLNPKKKGNGNNSGSDSVQVSTYINMDNTSLKIDRAWLDELFAANRFNKISANFQNAATVEEGDVRKLEDIGMKIKKLQDNAEKILKKYQSE